MRVESWYDDAGTVKGLWFEFTADKEDELINLPKNTPVGAIASKAILSNFSRKYARTVEKTAEVIVPKLLEYLPWYYVRSAGVPKIIVHDNDIEEPNFLNEIFESKMLSDSKDDDQEINGIKFNVTHVKLRAKASRKYLPIVKHLPVDSIAVDPRVSDAHLDKLLHGKSMKLSGHS